MKLLLLVCKTANNTQVSIKLVQINPHFICKLCQGYLRDAQAIKECLHTCTWRSQAAGLALFEMNGNCCCGGNEQLWTERFCLFTL